MKARRSIEVVDRTIQKLPGRKFPTALGGGSALNRNAWRKRRQIGGFTHAWPGNPGNANILGAALLAVLPKGLLSWKHSRKSKIAKA
jgi:hypothetical protein